jgi:hypothetical protein
MATSHNDVTPSILAIFLTAAISAMLIVFTYASLSGGARSSQPEPYRAAEHNALSGNAIQDAALSHHDKRGK